MNRLVIPFPPQAFIFHIPSLNYLLRNIYSMAVINTGVSMILKVCLLSLQLGRNHHNKIIRGLSNNYNTL